MLTALRRGEPLTAKEKTIHYDDLVTLLKQLHDEIDTAVLEAYGWSDLTPATMPFADLIARGGLEAEALEQELLTRLVALNHERAAEEKRGLIRWLRPEYQNPEAAKKEESHQATLDGLEDKVAKLETRESFVPGHRALARQTPRTGRPRQKAHPPTRHRSRHSLRRLRQSEKETAGVD